VVVVNPGVECGSIAWQVFKPYPEFLLTLEPAILVIVRGNGSIDLGTGGKSQFHSAASQSVGILTL
jgi:hypothetical protein